MTLRCLLINILFSTFLIQCSAQEFAEIGTTWHYTVIRSFFGPEQGYERMEVVKDTLIEDKLCRVLEHSMHGVDDVFNGFLRYEYLHVSGDTIFRYGLDSTFYVLYNFAAQAGDRWISRSYTDYVKPREIELVIEVMSTEERSIKGISAIVQEYRIAGSANDSRGYSYGTGIINSIFGGEDFFYPEGYAANDFNIRRGIRCYNSPSIGELQFFESQNTPYVQITSCEDVRVDTDDLVLHNGVNIYPNPASGIVSIDIDILERLADHSYLKIYDPIGQLIFAEPLNDQQQISLASKGLHIIHLSINGADILKPIINY